MADILVIDDAPVMRLIISLVLKKAGHIVHEAASGEEGIEEFHRACPALVVTDIVMPGMGGIEMIMKLREAGADIGILAISGGRGTGDVSYLDLARDAGADAGLSKPFTAGELLTAVQNLLGESQQPRPFDEGNVA